MQSLSSDNSNQQRRLDTLEPLITEKFSLLEESIDLFEEKSLDKPTQTAIVGRRHQQLNLLIGMLIFSFEFFYFDP